MTFGIVAGSVLAIEKYGRDVLRRPQDPAVVHDVGVYMLLLYTRWSSGWRGRRAAFLATCAFVIAIWRVGRQQLQPGAQVFPHEPRPHRREPPDGTGGGARAVRHLRGAPARGGEGAGVVPRGRRGDDRLHLQPGGDRWRARPTAMPICNGWLSAPALRLRSRSPIASTFTSIATRDAVGHVFRVASSLDSMVVGEPQILGQVKEAYATARAVGAVNSQLDALLTRALCRRQAGAQRNRDRHVGGVGRFGRRRAGQEDLRQPRRQERLSWSARARCASWRRAICSRTARRKIYVGNRTYERAVGAGREVQRRGHPLRPALRNRSPRRHRHQLHRRAPRHLPQGARRTVPARAARTVPCSSSTSPCRATSIRR